MNHLSLHVFAGALALFAVTAQAQEMVRFPPIGQTDITETVGTLYRPTGVGPFPAVAILHGCAGVRANSEDWARFLAANGVVALVTDQFSPRRVDRICEEFGLVSQRDRRMDTYGALQYLAGLPQVDRQRIGVMGFSHGGTATLNAANSRSNDRPGLTFAFAIPIYPSCQGYVGVSLSVRTLILVGGADDWTPAVDCERLLAQRPAASAEIGLRIYPGAHHAFDEQTQGYLFLPNVYNPSRSGGRGATVAFQRAAMEAARRDVLEFIQSGRR